MHIHLSINIDQVRMQLFKGVCGPGFLKNESDEVKDKFREIWFNEELGIEQKQAEFRKQAQELLKGDAVRQRNRKYMKYSCIYFTLIVCSIAFTDDSL